MYWGYSPALDLCEDYLKYICENKNELNILLFGNCDSRHILKTIAKSYKHNIKINFYCLDEFIESISRNMLLMLIAFERSQCISLKNKTQLFMDIYGNTLIRPFSYNYLLSKSKILIKIITNINYLNEIIPIFNINYLKYRQRDIIIEQLTFWSNQQEKFDIQKYWNNAIKKYLNKRYDVRNGIFDWDLQIHLKNNGIKQICSQEYKYWRETGIAFIFPEYEQSNPNKTLANNLYKNGIKYYTEKYREFDIILGPFCTYGIHISNEKYSKSIHGTNIYRSTDITERNLYEIMYEIQEKSELTKNDVDDDENFHKHGSIVLDLSKSVTTNQIIDNVELIDYNQPILDHLKSRFKIHFITLHNILQDNKIKNEWKKFFDIVFIANFYFPIIPKEFSSIFNDQSLILFETQAYSLLRKDDVNEFLNKIKNFAKDNNLMNITNFNINTPNFIVKYKTKNDE